MNLSDDLYAHSVAILCFSDCNWLESGKQKTLCGLMVAQPLSQRLKT